MHGIIVTLRNTVIVESVSSEPVLNWQEEERSLSPAGLSVLIRSS